MVYSGDVDYCRMACEKLRTAILDSKAEYSSVLEAIEKTLVKLYKGPIAAHPGPEKPSISLLIALRFAGEPFVSLIKTTETAVVGARGSEFIGAGAELARYVASKIYDFSCSTEEAALIAAYILHEVKRNVRGCGGISTIIALEPRSMGAALSNVVEKIEKRFKRNFVPEDFSDVHPLLDRLISSGP